MQLEAILPIPNDPALEHLGPQYFPVEELLGLCYASMSQDERAVPYLEAATRLNPKAEEAHTNLAASLLRLGRPDQALGEFREALAIAPQDYTANHNLGEFYIQGGKIAAAVPFLEKAQQIKPDAYDNGYDLATADLMVGRYAAGHQVVQSLLQLKNTGELHDLEAQFDEKEGKYVDAANEFETAAHLDPSENNLFDWGSELLLHRTYDPAIEVFRAAAQRYPSSPRILIGLGISLYARGLYEEAVKALLAGADISPREPRCYLFLSKAYYTQQSHTPEVIQRFHRYADLEPNNALAQYYYAMSLWKGGQTEGAPVDMQHVESLLQRAVTLDGKLTEAHFELGNLYSGRHDYAQSVPQYRRVIELDPKFADAHFRLATDYTHMGDKSQAQAEFAIYQKLRSEHLAASDKEGDELQQFVYTSKAPTGNP
ncbi:tetratricopeptide repeat protein [Granulicella sp. 5B5]|uniref:tetratricopeptide repeat protein n=1 Tax=Granulicella sp. 5B5 TaxID=1617967 RepID=UPI0021047F11|nr:tetratricopeptide repeat protein [Granulicella sp. 5B5]